MDMIAHDDPEGDYCDLGFFDARKCDPYLKITINDKTIYESDKEEKQRHEDKSDVTIDHTIAIPHVTLDTLVTIEMLDDDRGKDDNLLTKTITVDKIIEDASMGIRWRAPEPKQRGNFVQFKDVKWEDYSKWNDPAVTMGEFNLFLF